jgi:hypothetical protein
MLVGRRTRSVCPVSVPLDSRLDESVPIAYCSAVLAYVLFENAAIGAKLFFISVLQLTVQVKIIKYEYYNSHGI